MIEIATNDRVIGGLTPACAARAAELYRTFCRGELIVTDAASAEMAKLAENAYRDVNIAFANELSLICQRLGLDVWEIRQMANHHPRVEILRPGPGVGGHCIAVDPWFIVEAAPDLARLIRTARAVNDHMPAHTAEPDRRHLAPVPGPADRLPRPVVQGGRRGPAGEPGGRHHGPSRRRAARRQDPRGRAARAVAARPARRARQRGHDRRRARDRRVRRDRAAGRPQLLPHDQEDRSSRARWSTTPAACGDSPSGLTERAGRVKLDPQHGLASRQRDRLARRGEVGVLGVYPRPASS